MVVEVNKSQVLGRSADHFRDSAITRKVLLDNVLFVEALRNFPTLEDSAVCEGRVAEAL